MPRHPNGQIGHNPPRRVLGEDRDTGTGFPSLCPEVRCHPPGLVDRLTPSPLPDSSGHRLCQKDPVLSFTFPSEGALKRQLIISRAHRSLSPLDHFSLSPLTFALAFKL